MSAGRPDPTSPSESPPTDLVVAARRELRELTVLSGALLRLATKVQSRCDALRHTLGDVEPVDEDEIDRHAPRGTDGDRSSGVSAFEEEDPAVLLAISLAGEGMSREQIAEYLEQSFGMEDTGGLLDRVLPREG